MNLEFKVGLKRILITGGTGYIGSSLAEMLCKLGYEVHIIVRKESNLILLSDIKDTVKIHIFEGQTLELIDTIRKINPNLIIHLASLFIGSHTSAQLQEIIESNILFSTQVLEAASKSNTKYFINTGTHWQNYNDECYNPVNLYAATKEAFEIISKYYLQTSNMSMITLKLIDTYGPFDPRSKIINLLKKIHSTGEVLHMSSGEQELGLLYIDDVIKAYLVAIEKVQEMKPKEMESFLALPKEIHSLRSVVDIFQNVIGENLNIKWGKKPYRDREMMKVYTKEKNILEGHDTLTLFEGIKLMVNIEKQ
ncbi:NAD-dependent epimerase/dehydratase family protein [Clostridioides difficile]